MGNLQGIPHRYQTEYLSADQEVEYILQKSEEKRIRQKASAMARLQGQNQERAEASSSSPPGPPPTYSESLFIPDFLIHETSLPSRLCPPYTSRWYVSEEELSRRERLYTLRWAQQENASIAKLNGNRWRHAAPRDILNMSVALVPLLDVRTGAPIYGFPETVGATHEIDEDDARRILVALGERRAVPVHGVSADHVRTVLRWFVLDLGLRD